MTDPWGTKSKSRKNKTDPVYLFVPCVTNEHKLCKYGGQMEKITLIEISSAFSTFNGKSGLF